MPSARELGRLYAAIRRSRRDLAPFRRARMQLLQEYVGSHYGREDEGTTDRVPINLIELLISVYLRQLVAHRPRAAVRTAKPNLRPFAARFEAAINKDIAEMHLEDALQEWVLEAMLGLGILLVQLQPDGWIEWEAETIPYGRPCADVVTLDDFFYDTTAFRFEEASFMGHYQRVPLEWAREYPGFDAKVRKLLQPDETLTRDEEGEDKDSSLAFGEDSAGDEFEEWVTIKNVWLPRSNRLITTPAYFEPSRPLREVEWDGPEGGPYHRLCFARVPNNAMPKSPAASGLDLHLLANVLMNKLGRQAERAKTVGGYRAGAEEDAQRVVEAEDAEWVRMDDPVGSVREFKFGGVDGATLAFFMQVRELFSYLGGNIDALGGLNPAAPTLGQEQLLSASASRRAADMQERVVAATRKVIRAIAWYRWTDPLRSDEVYRQIPGTPYGVWSQWDPEVREGDFLEYEIDIEPYSMQHSSPQTRLAAVLQFLQLITPYLPQMQAQGLTIDFEALARIFARETGSKEISELLITSTTQSGRMQEAGQGAAHERSTAPETTRTHVRVNRPEQPSAFADRNVMQSLLKMNGRQSQQFGA